MAKAAVKLTASDDLVPVCPHCGNQLDEIYMTTEGYWSLIKNRIYFCPHCLKVLGAGPTM